MCWRECDGHGSEADTKETGGKGAGSERRAREGEERERKSMPHGVRAKLMREMFFHFLLCDDEAVWRSERGGGKRGVGEERVDGSKCVCVCVRLPALDACA